jgi:predicted peptidase
MQDGRAAHFLRREFTSQGRAMPYRLLLPRRMDREQAYPIVLFLHGAGERGDDNEAPLRHGVLHLATEEARRRFPCFVVVPQCPPEERWVEVPWDAPAHEQPAQPAAPLRLALTLISDLQLELPVDTGRIYVAGVSMGGFGAWDAVTRHPRLFAACVPVCGGADLERARAVVELGIWAFHGALDTVVPPGRSRDMIAAIREAGGHPRYTEFPDLGHECYEQAFGDPALLPWLFSQRRA